LTHSPYGWSKTKAQNDPEEQPGKKQVEYSISLENVVGNREKLRPAEYISNYLVTHFNNMVWILATKISYFWKDTNNIHVFIKYLITNFDKFLQWNWSKVSLVKSSLELQNSTR